MATEAQVVEYIDTNPEDDRLRQALAVEGPAVIPVAVTGTLHSIKGIRKYIENPVPAVGWQAMRSVDRRMVRAEHLVKAVSLRSREWGTQVGMQLVILLRNPDADVRALAALFCAVDGIPPISYGRQVVERFQIDRDELVRVAAAICMATVPDAPRSALEESAQAVMTFFATTDEAFPDLVQQVRLELQGHDEGAQVLMIAKTAVYRLVAAR